MSVVPLSRARLLGLILGMPVAIGLAVGVLAWQRGDAWKAMALDALNGHIEGQLVVEDVALSWWHGFPDISVDVSDARLLSNAGDTLIAAKRLGMALDFWSLWGDHPKLGTITIDGGRARLAMDDKGRWANVPFVTNDAGDDPAANHWRLGSVVVRDCALSIAGVGKRGVSLNVDQLKCTLDSPRSAIQWQGSMSNVTLNDPDLPPLKPFGVNTSGLWRAIGLDAWSTEGKLELLGMDATWAASKTDNKPWLANVTANGISQKRLDNVLMGAPWENRVTFDHNISLEAALTPDESTIHWSTSKDAFQIAPSWTGLSMSLQGTAQSQGVVRRKHGSWSWDLEHADVSGPGWEILGHAKPTSGNGVTLTGRARLDASTPFDAWLPGVPQSVSSVLPISGHLRAEGDITLDARGGVQSVHATLNAEQLAGQLDGQRYQLDVRNLHIDPQHASADTLAFDWAGNQTNVDFSALTWPALIHGSALSGKVFLRANALVVDPILQWWDHLNLPPSSAAVLLPAGSELEVSLDASQVDWGALRCEPVTARTTVTHNRWLLHSIQVEGLEGRAHVEGQLSPGRAGWILTLRGSLDDVSAPSLFSTFNNFDQTLLRHDHLAGALSTAGSLSMSWGLDGSWHPEHMTASLQTNVQHGRLRNLEVFDDVANYLDNHRLMAPLVDPEDLRQRLRDITFEPVDQRIDVRGEQVWLPKTVIESSAMNVAIQGVYNFDSNIDYTLGFALRDLRASASDNVGVMEDDGLGTRVFLRMFGEVNEPEYAYDRDAAKAHRRAAFATEKERLRNALSRRGADSDELDDAPMRGPEQPQDSPNPEEMPHASPVQKPKKNKKKDRDRDLFNPDDEDYL